jgi:hypothetical protein
MWHSKLRIFISVLLHNIQGIRVLMLFCRYEDALFKHMKIGHGKTEYLPMEVQSSSKSYYILKDNKYYCTLCPATYTDLRLFLQYHLCEHVPSEKMFPCNVCNNFFTVSTLCFLIIEMYSLFDKSVSGITRKLLILTY